MKRFKIRDKVRLVKNEWGFSLGLPPVGSVGRVVRVMIVPLTGQIVAVDFDGCDDTVRVESGWLELAE